MAYEEESDKKSVFNAGVAQVERIDALQRAINMARFNPLAKNADVGRFNYEIMISANDALLSEAWSKLTKDEKEGGQKIKKIVHDYIEMNPIVVMKRDEMRVNNQHYKMFMELIDFYENLNKTFLEAHDLNSPSRAEEDDDEL